MPDKIAVPNGLKDRTNMIIAGLVFGIAFVVYALTVQRTFSFWDCGEFIACAYGLSVPHPPGTPLFILLGRVFSIIPFVEDISYRINYISVISSALTAALSYLLTVKMVGYFFGEEKNKSINRYIAYIGGVAGGLFVAFSRTNWGNSVEAEVYGMALALSVGLVLLTIRYFELRGTAEADKTLIAFFYMAMLGIGIHMTVFLVVPMCAIFFILKKEATQTDWILVCGYLIVELLLMLLFSVSGIGRPHIAFTVVSVLLALGLLVKLHDKINWAILIAIAAASTVMISFSLSFWALGGAVVVIGIMGVYAKRLRWRLHWKAGLAILLISIIGLSVHLYIPIRSSQNPRIDENNPSRDTQTFIDFLDRKQYGQMSMVERMFKRRGTLANQFGRHPHMGFWSYFEEQYSNTGWSFILPFFAFGLIGIVTAIKKRLQLGLPFLVLLLLCSAGLVLYMNFADGTQYDINTNDAYLEVRNRDYFFTPAFVFFGIAMGMGISAVMKYLKDALTLRNPNIMRPVVFASGILVILPGVSFAHNYHACDRSQNFLPYNYAASILDSCEENAILFTSGDNDTFPLWCIQEVYGYRLDVRVVNLSLLNTDWYTLQMKNQYNVPISLTEEQILWNEVEQGGVMGKRPAKPFYDKARRRQGYLIPTPYNNRILRVQDMMVDEIVFESIVAADSGDDWSFKQPIYFSSPPYAESPLNLQQRANATGVIYKLEKNPNPRNIDVETGYDLFMNKYRFDGLENSEVYRNENATGVYLGMGINSVRIFGELERMGDTARAIAFAEHLIEVYPEYWQTYLLLGDLLQRNGDSTAVDRLTRQLHDTLTAFHESNPENLFYLQDLGLTKAEIGRNTGDQALINEGIALLWEAFEANKNSAYGFRKLYSVLAQNGRVSDIQLAAEKFAEYKINRSDPLLQQLRGGGPTNLPQTGP
ncbi:MAG: DUF2723 domain-containing protein [bacterium]|nr:DUF2723 domain-containing protein [bacterium]